MFATPQPDLKPMSDFEPQYSSQSSESYTQEDVHKILELAIARQVHIGAPEFTRGQLVEIANEMGISMAELESAEQEWTVRRSDLYQRNQFDKQRQQRFYNRFTRYAIVNVFFAVLSLVTVKFIVSGVSFLAIVWGLFVALDGWNTFFVKGDRYESAFQSWRRRTLIKRSVNIFFDRWLR